MGRRIVDLGLRLTEGLKTWDVKPPFTMLPCMSAATFRLGFSTKLLIMEDHCGTHVDSTYHFYDSEFRTPQGRTIDELPLEDFMGEGVLIDVSFKAPTEGTVGARLPPGDVSGWRATLLGEDGDQNRVGEVRDKGVEPRPDLVEGGIPKDALESR